MLKPSILFTISFASIFFLKSAVSQSLEELEIMDEKALSKLEQTNHPALADEEVISMVSLYVKPHMRELFEKKISSGEADYTKNDGILHAYWLRPTGNGESSPYKHLIFWKSKADFDVFMKSKYQQHSSTGLTYYYRRPIIEMYNVTKSVANQKKKDS